MDVRNFLALIPLCVCMCVLKHKKWSIGIANVFVCLHDFLSSCVWTSFDLQAFFFLSCYFFHHKTECCIFSCTTQNLFIPFLLIIYIFMMLMEKNNKLMRFSIYILEVITKISGSNMELHIMFYQYAVSFSMPSILSHRKNDGAAACVCAGSVWDLRGSFYKYTQLEENLGCTNSQTNQHKVHNPKCKSEERRTALTSYRPQSFN